MLASGGGHEGCLQLLMAAGANIEHQDKVRACKFTCVIFNKDDQFGWYQFLHLSLLSTAISSPFPTPIELRYSARENDALDH